MTTKTQPKIKEPATARDRFIVEQYLKGFSPTEILVLLTREGFRKPARSRIYQILATNGVELKT